MSEDATEIVLQAARELQCDMIASQIVSCKRYRPSKVGGPSNIAVRLSSPLLRDKLVQAGKAANKANSPLKTTALGVPGEPRVVFINPMMTKDTKKLYDHARSLRTERGFKYIWYSDCRVWARRDEKARAFALESIEHVNFLLRPPRHSDPEKLTSPASDSAAA
jgi:hypothetical protein